MPLTPEEIEARRFRLTQNGYDCESVDRFLSEIADALRTPTPAVFGADEFGRMGQEIAAILRNARDSAGAVRAEAEGHAAALRSRAELEADDVRKQAETEAEEVRSRAQAAADELLAEARRDADAQRASAGADAEAQRAAAVADADQMRLETERQLEQATQIRARADEQMASARASAEREASARLERAEHEARRRADEITTEATQRAEAIRESEQSTYLRLLAARDDLQLAIDRLVAQIDGDPRSVSAPVESERDERADEPSVVDLTTAPPQVHRGPAHVVGTSGLDADDEQSRAPRPIASVGLDSTGGPPGGDPLLRMVRAAVGRAAEGSTSDDPEQEASAS